MSRHVAYRWLVATTVIVGGTFGVPGTTSTAAPSIVHGAPELSQQGWIWPVDTFRLTAPFVQPAHEYGPGHRGVDLDLLGETAVHSPADGTIAFVGDVAGRPVVTIEHDGELVSTLEPVMSHLSPGAVVGGGEAVGVLGSGGHTAPGELHFGVRLRGAYINPLLLLGGIARAVLLPCCE